MDLTYTELLVLAFIAVVLLKPEEIRGMAHQFGRWIGQVRRMSQEFTREFTREVDAEGLKQEVLKIKKDVSDSMKGAWAQIEGEIAEEDKKLLMNPLATLEEMDKKLDKKTDKKAGAESKPSAPSETANAGASSETPQGEN